MKLNQSRQLFKQAQKVLVGGVNSPVRAFKNVGGQPLVMARGKGAKVFDVDGHAYTDYCLSWGALILGHADPKVTATVKRSLANGSSFGATTEPEIHLAKLISSMVPSVEKIRFVNSGTEATMSAIRLARGFTGRSKVVKFDGCYHGHADDLLACAGSGVANLASSSSQGIPEAHLQDTLSIPFNDMAQMTRVIKKHHKDIACVIVEPVAGNMGVILPQPGFLQELRRLTSQCGIVLIFDEVMSGFRTNPAGAQKDFKIKPDLTCFGKIIGGGYPIGAYGGRGEIMDHLAPLGRVYQAGTFSGNPLVMQAGIAVLESISLTDYRHLNDLCDIFVLNTNKQLSRMGAGVHLVNYKSMISIRMGAEPVINYRQAIQSAADPVYARLFHFLLKNGIYWPPANLETFFVSMKHTQAELNRLMALIIQFFDKERTHAK